jgi:hypothetical protein
MFNPNMMFLARQAQMNAVMNQAFFNQAVQNQPVTTQPFMNLSPQAQAILNRVTQNQAVPTQFVPIQGPAVEVVPPVAVGMGACEAELARAGDIIAGLGTSFFQARDLIQEVRTLAQAEGQTAVVEEMTNALALLIQPSSPSFSMFTPCEERLRVAQSLIGSVVNTFDTRLIPALTLGIYFLAPRRDRADARDLFDRVRLFFMQVQATTLAAARRVIPLNIR